MKGQLLTAWHVHQQMNLPEAQRINVKVPFISGVPSLNCKR
jgi:hypothetical protein